MISADSPFYVTGGTLRQDAACYVERQADKDLLDGLLKGEFCYVLTSRQMGKRSLMVRTVGKVFGGSSPPLRGQGVTCVCSIAPLSQLERVLDFGFSGRVASVFGQPVAAFVPAGVGRPVAGAFRVARKNHTQR